MAKIKMLCLGAGNMTSAIVPAFTRAVPSLTISAFTPSGERAKRLAEKVQGEWVEQISTDDLSQYSVILLGFKPQQFDDVAKKLTGKLNSGQLIISLLAGTSLDKIQKVLGVEQVVRLMPNTPAQVGMGASLMAFGANVSPEWKAFALKLLKALGVGVEVTEDQLNLATPFSGSGPAYFFLLTQLMIEDLQERGFNAEDARSLCEQTFIGAAELLKKSDISVESLRQNVTSKGGVTHAAVESMLNSGLQELLHKAIEQALTRNQELNQA